MLCPFITSIAMPLEPPMMQVVRSSGIGSGSPLPTGREAVPRADLTDADPLRLLAIRKAAGGFAGTVVYMVKPPYYGYLVWREMRGRLHYRGKALPLKRHHRLFTHPPNDYPDLTLSGGAGVAVLRAARAAADWPFRHPPAIIGLAALAVGWEEKPGFGAEHPVLKLELPLSDMVGMNVKLLSQLAQRLLAPYGNQGIFALKARKRV
jgi:hypothetical protein